MGGFVRLLLVLLVLCATSSVSLAQPSDSERATARALAEEAQSALDRKDFKRAAELFTRANAIFAAPTLTLGLARAQVGQGRLVAALETYNRVVRQGAPAGSPPAFTKAVAEAQTELDALAPRVPWLTVKVEGPADAAVTLDGAALKPALIGVKQAVDPGEHTLRATAEGFAPVEMSVTLAEGASEERTLVLKPPGEEAPGDAGAAEAAADAPSGGGTRTLGFIVGGLGVAGIAVGAVTGVMTLGKKGVVDDHCNADGGCDQEGLDAASSGRTLSTVSTIAFAAGLGLTALGVFLVVSSDSGTSETAVGVAAVPQGASLLARSRF